MPSELRGGFAASHKFDSKATKKYPIRQHQSNGSFSCEVANSGVKNRVDLNNHVKQYSNSSEYQLL